MTQLSITPLTTICDREKDRPSYGEFSLPDERKGIDSKVQGFAQSKIGGNPGSLFASATAPKVILIPDLPVHVEEEIFLLPKREKFKKKPSLQSSDARGQEPIGLMPCDPDSWINAVMQLIFRLPVLRTILTVSAPQSYEPFRVFMDQYNEDREACLPVSSADGAELVRCLRRTLQPSLFAPFGNANLFKIFQEIIRCGFPSSPLSYEVGRNHEGYSQIEWDAKEGPLLHLIRKMSLVGTAPSDLLVSVKGKSEKNSCRLIPKQIFDPDQSIYYDLYGFIENRQDFGQIESIAYLKIEGKNWYQCRNQRISKLCSTNLSLPLLSSDLLHYRKCCPGVLRPGL